MLTFGFFHRNRATYQTPEVAALQVATREIWGRTPQNGFIPAVQAYSELGIKQESRIEFSTDVPPGAVTPFEAWWYLGEKGVQRRVKLGADYSCISVEISSNTIV